MKIKIIISFLIFVLLGLGITNAIMYKSGPMKWIVINDSIRFLSPSVNWKKDLSTGKIIYTKNKNTTWVYENENESKYITSTKTLIKRDGEIRYITPSGTFVKRGKKIVYTTPTTTLIIEEDGKIKYITPTITRIIDGDKFKYITPSSK